MNKLFKTIALVGAFIAGIATADACTNLIVTRGASTDGSNMVTYAADSHGLYGSLYSYVPGKYTPFMDVTEWDTGRYIGKIPQVEVRYRTLGNSNEHSLFITETTFGGRPELENPNGCIDYGSLIYITLQRAKTAREAIDIIVNLANTHGYCSSGESFTLVDTEEAWIMELIGKGPEDKGIVWVARRIPDGYVSAHANQARITTFPWNDPENCIYAADVADVARKFGWFDGKNEDFSFADAYAPLDFGAMRGCEARVWAFFRTVADDMDKYEDYAMGHNPNNRMPLWVMPREKVSPKLLMDCMRDHYEGTKMDMTTDIGAGGEGCPYRWRPMYFEADGGAGDKLTSGAEGAQRGHDMVMTPHLICYYDYSQDLPDDPFQYIGGHVPLEKAYSFDPCDGVADDARAHVLGGQCNNWSEFTWNEHDLAWKMWPRTCAMAEALWTAPAPRDFKDFLKRMEVHRKRLVSMGVNCAPLR